MNGIIKKVSEEKKYYIALVVIFIMSMMIATISHLRTDLKRFLRPDNTVLRSYFSFLYLPER